MSNLMIASNQWATRPADQRFQTLQALRDSVHGRRLRSRSVDVDLSRVSVGLRSLPPVNETDAPEDVIEINSAIAPSEPTHWGFGQLAGLVGAPANYLRSLPKPLVRDALNFGITSTGQARGSVKFMTIANDDANATLQAVTSTTYGRIWDADVVDAVGRIVERSNGKFHNPLAYKLDLTKGTGFKGITGETEPSGLYASDRDVFVFMIDGGSYLESGPRAQFYRGFIVWNSEVGAKTFGLMTFLHNGVCGNHIIWGARDVNQLLIRHTRNAPTRFDNEAFPALVEYAASSADAELTVIKRAQARALPKAQEDLLKLVEPFKITRAELREAENFANREEGQFATLFDLVQGGTAYARGFDYVDARVDAEKRFSSLLRIVE